MPTILKTDSSQQPLSDRRSVLLSQHSNTLNTSTSIQDVQTTNTGYSAVEQLRPAAKRSLMDRLLNRNKVRSTTSSNTKSKIPRGKLISLLLIISSIFVLGAGAYFGYNVLAVSNGSFGQGSDLGFWGQLGKLAGTVTNQRQPLKGEAEGRTNIVLIGRDAIGSGLTDSIMIGSYYYEEKKFVTLNIPRDFYINDGYGGYKINSLYAFAEQREAGSGEQALADFLGKEFGIPIHYWASINFGGLEKVVDELGGIEVDVPNGFTDCAYPDRRMQGYIYPCPSFEKGLTRMNGETALIYARSRKGDNGEGSDFARSRRQSLVIQAIAQKAKESGVTLNASKVNSYFEILGGTLRTNARIDEIVSGAGLRDDFDPKQGFLRIVWDTNNGILCDDSTSDGAYIIVYCDGTIAGRPSTSKYRAEAQYVVQNLLQRSELAALFDAKVVMYGNLSTDTDKFYAEFEKAGFNNITFNNNYRQIKAATATSTEIVSIYIKDEAIRNMFNKLDPQIGGGSFKLMETPPETVILPTNATDADIIVWVASV